MAPTFAALAYVEIEPGVTVYSGYPLAEFDGRSVTFSGVPGSFAPAVVMGAKSVSDTQGKPVSTQSCGDGLCFEAEGGGTYALQP
jgi:hypothetical protein